MNTFRRIITLLNKPLPLKSVPWLLAAVTVLALIVRIAALYFEPTISRDGTIYVDLANQWLQTGEYPRHFYLPLYPFLMKLLMQCGLSAYAAGTGISIAFGTLMPLVCYGILRQFPLRREVALAGALLMAVHPSAVDLAINIQRDAASLFFAGLVILTALLSIRTGKAVHWMMCGLALAPAVLSRYENLEFLPLILIYFLAALLCRALSWKDMFRNGFACLLSFCFLTAAAVWVMEVYDQMAWAYRERVERIRTENK